MSYRPTVSNVLSTKAEGPTEVSLKRVDRQNEVKNVWYSTIVYARPQTGLPTLTPCVINDQRSQNLLNRAGDYRMSITKFRCETSTIPAYQVEPLLGQPDVTVLAASFSLESGGTIITENITWYPEYDSAPVPSTPETGAGSDYYSGWSFKHLCRLINLTLQSLNTQLIAAVPALAGTPACFVVYYPATQSITLFAPATEYDMATGAPTIFLHTNSVGYQFLPLIGTVIDRGDAVRTYTYQIYEQADASNLDTLGAVTYLTMPQECPGGMNFLFPCSSLVFTTHTMPIETETTSVLYLGQVAMNQSTINTIIDFSPGVALGSELRFDVTYQPSGMWRWCDLKGTDPLKAVTMQIMWVDWKGRFHPLMLPEDGSASVKILFQPKDADLY